jgi:hypothetical protein
MNQPRGLLRGIREEQKFSVSKYKPGFFTGNMGKEIIRKRVL